MHPGPGSRLDAYELLHPLGRGGMGEVWVARDVRLGRKVAIKLLPAELTRDAGRVARFEHEARAASALNHPNVCTILGFGEATDGQHYIAMELVEGETLRKRLMASPIGLREATDIAIQVGSALSAAHASGIVHRDIKPENVMVRPDGLVKVLDFGLAKLGSSEPALVATDETRTAMLTEPGAVVGTAAYMSPEQARGQPVDSRSDIWSLGLLLYEMMAGRNPFVGETASDTLAAILTRDPPLLSDLDPTTPSDLQRAVSRALQKERRDRYHDVRDLVLDLRALSTANRPTEGRPNTSTPSKEPSHGRRRPFAVRAAIVAVPLLMAVGLLGVWLTRAHEAEAPVKSLAVLPLRNLSGDPKQEYFADGMTDALITELAQIKALRVISRTSSMQFKGKGGDAKSIGRDLNVDAIVEGSVRRSGNRVGITVELIHAASDRHLWADSYERDLRDVLEVHRDVAAAVAAEVSSTLSLRPGGSARRVDPDAYDAYVRGRYFWNLRSEDNLRKAITYFDQALKQDPSYAPAYSGIADSHFYLGYAFGKVPPVQAMPLARAAAVKSVALDDGLAEGHASLALVHLMYDWDWTGAEKEFEKAIALNPSYALAHHGYAVLLMTVGRLDDAVAEARRALTVDPLSIPINNILGIALSTAGQHQQAIEQFRRTLELNPTPGANGNLASEYELIGRNDDALRERLAAKTFVGATAKSIESLREAYQSGGWLGYRRESLKQAIAAFDGWHWDAYEIAQLHAALGQNNEALSWLERVRDARSGAVVWFPTDRVLNANLKDEPRYQALLRSMHLRAVSSR